MKKHKMTRDRALKIALKSLEVSMQRYVFDANLYAAGQISPGTERAALKYQELAEAYGYISGMLAQRVMEI